DAPHSDDYVEVSGTMATGNGHVVHSFKVPLTVEGIFDARINGIEVTQGIQGSSLPQRGTDLNAPVPYHGSDPSVVLDTNAPLDDPFHPFSLLYPPDYSVDLAAGGKTIVRVFANLRKGPSDGTNVGGSVVLYGYRDNQPLSDQPLHPEF